MIMMIFLKLKFNQTNMLNHHLSIKINFNKISINYLVETLFNF